jgi:hypothetical protein
MNYANEIEYIESKLDERRTEVEQHLGRGAAKNYDEYQKLCGVIQGLDYTKQILLDLAQRMEIDANE